ncbi:MAG: MATE family efflux transporter [Clostridia bacterium]|nr:MATE family efflux transporter [Clostridia bacterium]MBQ8446863.1 MATE family efflux transporter [Clostridia bacterium]
MSEMTEEQLNAADAAVIEREKKQFVKMTQTRISRLIISLGIPTTLSMMVTSLYNLADTFFVSQLKNDAITAAANNLLALMSIIQALGFTFGMGSGNIVSRLLGKRDREGADKVFSSTLVVSCICGLLIMGVGFAFFTPMLKLFGCNGNTLVYGKAYAKWLLIAAPFMCMSFVLNNVLRAEGKAVLSMVGLVVGAVVNVVLDPILIFSADMGIEGAAIATCASQILSFSVLLFMFVFRLTIVRFRVNAISRRFSVYRDVLATGFPSFLRQILASLCTVFLNRAAYTYGVQKYATEAGGDAAQAALGVVNKVFMLAFSLSLGIGQGYQPVLGYNYSAKRFDRVKEAYLFTLSFSTVVMTVFASVCAIFATQVVGIFNVSAEAKEIGALSLRLQCICMPLLPLNFMVGLTYQSVGNKALAALLSASRQGLFYIPAVLALPKIFGLLGVQMCQSVADACAFLFAIPFTFMFFTTLKKEQAKVIEEEKINSKENL